VLLALDSIAIVDASTIEPLRAALARFDDGNSLTVGDYTGIGNIIDAARALLAAANAAEQDTTA
jgi:hypothetical protein